MYCPRIKSYYLLHKLAIVNDFLENLLHEFHTPLQNPVLIFSLILFIILLSPILLKKINIPGIVGLIIAGVVIGPHGFNILEQNSAVTLFSTIGLLYIMFIAGLELDMAEFRKNKYKSILLGFYTFILPISIGFPVCYYLLHYNFNASFLTASMFATHTLVAYPIVSKMGISKNQAVAITVGATVLTDTMVLIILAVVMGNAHGNLNQAFWIKLVTSLLLFSGIMFLIIPRVAKWFFRKLESEKHSHYIFVLAVVFFAAFLSQMAGVEPIIGAFVAGLALNPLIPRSSALMNRIEFIGNSLFIPFFLISVGMIVDVAVIFKGPMALIIAGTLTTVALLGKWIASFLAQVSFKYTSIQRRLIFGLSSSHAAATLAIILVGYRAGILDENILNGTIILILITCIIASFVTEKAAKQFVSLSENRPPEEDTGHTMETEHILLAISNAQSLEKLLDFSILIKNKKSASPITLLSVVPNDDEAELNILREKQKIDSILSLGAATETKLNFITSIDHNVASGIARTSKEIMANIIILGWPQRTGILDKLIGEKIEYIVRHTDKTIFISYLPAPLVTNTKIVIMAPPLAELEDGFTVWLSKVFLLAHELNVSLVFHCEQKTEEAIKHIVKQSNLSALYNIEPFNDWDDFLVLSRKIAPEDIIVLVSARKGSVSHIDVLDGLPLKLEKYFEHNTRIIIYPQQFNHKYLVDSHEEINTESLSKGIRTIQKIWKGLGNT